MSERKSVEWGHGGCFQGTWQYTGKQVILMFSQHIHLELRVKGFRQVSSKTFHLETGATDVAYMARLIEIYTKENATKKRSKNKVTRFKCLGIHTIALVLEVNVVDRVFPRSTRSEFVVTVSCENLKSLVIKSTKVFRSFSTVGCLCLPFGVTG